MKTIGNRTQSLTLFTFLLAGLVSPAWTTPVQRQGVGATPAELQGQIDVFKADLGGADNGVGGGPFADGYRHIDWDGISPAAAAPNLLATDFFNSTIPVGLELSTPGTGLQVSAEAANGPVRFDNLDPSYSGTFQAFSGEQLITPIDSTVTDVMFFVPGDPTQPAYVNGFGVVFSDVDELLNASLEFFDLQGTSLHTALALNSPDGGLSFLGYFNDEQQIGRVRITSGTAALGAGVVDGGGIDLVAMDDFYFSEPKAVPEPGVLTLFGLGALAAFGIQFWRRR